MQKRSWVKLAAVGAVAALTLTACSNSKKDTGGGLGGGTTANSGGGASTTYKIGFEGPLSGDNQQLGINEANSVQLAIEQANAQTDLGFKLAYVPSDDGGTGAGAPAAAARLLQDPAVIGEIGPSFSGATKAVGKTYGDAGLVMITPSASNGTLQDQGFTTFHRIIPNDNVEGTQGGEWLVRKGLKKVYIVDDLSDYGKGVADTLEAALKKGGVAVTRQGADGASKTTNYSVVASAIKASGAPAIFYAGYDAQAAQLASRLKAVGYTGLTVTGNGGKSSTFTKGAGSAGNGWYFTCGCQDATIAPSAKAFTAAYKAKFNTDPSTYSPEAFDATNLLIQAIKDAKAKGEVTRKSVLDAVNAIKYKGITADLSFLANGEPAGVIPVYLYKQEGGVIKSVSAIKDAN